MQMLCFRFVSYKDVISDGGRCFKGVHLSQVHQQRNIEVTLAWLVQLRQLHPLKKALRNRNKKAAGHAIMSSGLYIII